MGYNLKDIVSGMGRSKCGTESLKTRASPIPVTQDVPDVCAIDGGSCILWSRGDRSIGVVRYAWVCYDSSFKILKMHVESAFVEGSESEIGKRRESEEARLAGECAKPGRIVLCDGALSDETRKAVGSDRKCPVVGISKSSSLSYLVPGRPDTSVSLGAISYLRYPDDIQAAIRHAKGGKEKVCTVLAQLHRQGRTYRADIAGEPEKTLSQIVPYCGYFLCPGYPFPLEEAHRIACLDDKKDMYQGMLREEMISQGMFDEYISGKIENNRERGEFHSVLDSLV